MSHLNVKILKVKIRSTIESILKSIVKSLLGRFYTYKIRYFFNKDKNQFYDSLTDLVMERVLADDAICVDVGCHEGAILDVMLAHAPAGKFYAFEPLPHLFAHLLGRYGKRAEINLYNLALSNAAGSTSFNHVISNPGYSGFIKRRYDRPVEEDTQITVNTALLDSLVDPGDAVNFIKIDVEGAELQVLQGARQLIKKHKPVIVFEHGLGAADIYGTTPTDIYELLCVECGLQISLMDRWLKNKPALTLDEFNRQFSQGLDYYFIAYAGTAD